MKNDRIQGILFDADTTITFEKSPKHLIRRPKLLKRVKRLRATMPKQKSVPKSPKPQLINDFEVPQSLSEALDGVRRQKTGTAKQPRRPF